MPEVISKVMKINLRVRSKERINTLLQDILGGVPGPNRGATTIGDFDGAYIDVGGVTFDVMVPNEPDGALAKVIDKHGEGIDSICFAVEDMNYTEGALNEHGIEFARRHSFHGNEIAFVRPRDACGISLEFIQASVD
jgi:methylmalonyl-CoA/ethylmalonyl-CoA epimerase